MYDESLFAIYFQKLHIKNQHSSTWKPMIFSKLYSNEQTNQESLGEPLDHHNLNEVVSAASFSLLHTCYIYTGEKYGMIDKYGSGFT